MLAELGVGWERDERRPKQKQMPQLGVVPRLSLSITQSLDVLRLSV